MRRTLPGRARRSPDEKEGWTEEREREKENGREGEGENLGDEFNSISRKVVERKGREELPACLPARSPALPLYGNCPSVGRSVGRTKKEQERS